MKFGRSTPEELAKPKIELKPGNVYDWSGEYPDKGKRLDDAKWLREFADQLELNSIGADSANVVMRNLISKEIRKKLRAIADRMDPIEGENDAT